MANDPAKRERKNSEAPMTTIPLTKPLLAVLVVCVVCAGGVLALKSRFAREIPPQANDHTDLAQAHYQAPHVAPDPPTPEQMAGSQGEPAQANRTIPSAESGRKPKAKIPAPASVDQAAAPRGKEPIQDPLARVALAFVGADPEAEMYWVEAINDPSLPAKERQDLIEDLNEDGLSDPRHPTLDDLPLIVSRLEWIEALAPDAMDKVNADAFAEAYKDLSNMYNSLVGPR
jgi:hypothetical protein